MKLVLDDPVYHGRRRFIATKVKMLLIIIFAVLVLSAAGVLLGTMLANTLHGGIKIPEPILQQAKSQLYLPNSLPGTYKLTDNSFSIQEEAVLFTATDGTGSKIIFTEQVKPKDMNFDDFYKENFDDAKILSDVPYPSVVGKNPQTGGIMLSIVTDETWILATSASPLSQDDMQRIASGLKPY